SSRAARIGLRCMENLQGRMARSPIPTPGLPGVRQLSFSVDRTRRWYRFADRCADLPAQVVAPAVDGAVPVLSAGVIGAQRDLLDGADRPDLERLGRVRRGHPELAEA